MAGIAIVPIILLLLVALGVRRNVSSKLNMNKKWTYIFFGTYIVVLLIATITIEIFNTRLDEQPERVTEKELTEIETNLFNGSLENVDPGLVIDERKHNVGNVLSISTLNDEYYPNVVIERKNVNDGVIEETIYKPQLITDTYDLSDRMKFNLPEWQDDEVLLLTPPPFKIALKSYEDAFLLSQFSTGGNRFNSHGSMSRQIIVHLLVPKDLEIEAEEEMYIDYVNE